VCVCVSVCVWVGVRVGVCVPAWVCVGICIEEHSPLPNLSTYATIRADRGGMRRMRLVVLGREAPAQPCSRAVIRRIGGEWVYVIVAVGV
jgi:hypothetical protein